MGVKLSFVGSAIEEKVLDHQRGCDGDTYFYKLCPCETVIVLVCFKCKTPLLMVSVEPNPCEHGVEFLSDGKGWFGSRGEGAYISMEDVEFLLGRQHN